MCPTGGDALSVSQQAGKRKGMNPRWSTAIANEHGGEILRWYEGLEAQVMDFIHVVPPHGNNQQVWSSKLATVLVEACCLIESIFVITQPGSKKALAGESAF
jgi:hypothetical protein